MSINHKVVGFEFPTRPSFAEFSQRISLAPFIPGYEDAVAPFSDPSFQNIKRVPLFHQYHLTPGTKGVALVPKVPSSDPNAPASFGLYHFGFQGESNGVILSGFFQRDSEEQGELYVIAAGESDAQLDDLLGQFQNATSLPQRELRENEREKYASLSEAIAKGWGGVPKRSPFKDRTYLFAIPLQLDFPSNIPLTVSRETTL